MTSTATDRPPYLWVGETAPRMLGDHLVWLDSARITLDGDLEATLRVDGSRADMQGGETHAFPGVGTFRLIQVEPHARLGAGGGNRAKFEVDLSPLTAGR